MSDDHFRQFSFLDAVIERFDAVFRGHEVNLETISLEDYPSVEQEKVWESESEKLNVVALVRVNHAGEISAQGLYLGQALFSREQDIFQFLKKAASEEHRHLVWCTRRIYELGGTTSVFTPVWFLGSFMIGAFVAIAGDPRSLGFVEETEKQVSQHLDGHLSRIPQDDQITRLLLSQMRKEELEHGRDAESLGGVEPPYFAKRLMGIVALVMKETAEKF